MQRSLFWLMVVSGGCWLAGCGGVDLPDRAPVHGVVTLDGQPMTTGEITFMPDESKGTIGPSASGVIDAGGHYKLTTDHQGRGDDGAIIGFHLVRIVARETVEPGAPSKSLIPSRYGDFKTSGFTAEVKAGTGNQFNWPLTSK
jgi:hypothetical protein